MSVLGSKKPPAEIMALGPGDRLVPVVFPFRGQKLECVAGPISKLTPVAVVMGAGWRRAANRVCIHGYDLRAVGENRDAVREELLRSLSA